MKTKEQCEKALSARKQKIENFEDIIKKFESWKEVAQRADDTKLYIEVCKDIEKTQKELDLVQAEVDILQTILEI